MSTLTVSEILGVTSLSVTSFKSNTSGEPPLLKDADDVEVVQGAWAWVNYNGATNTIRDSFNVASVTDNGTGDFTVVFDNALPNANYCPMTAGRRPDSSLDSIVGLSRTSDPSTTACQILCSNGNGTAQDFDYVCVGFLGNP